MTKTKITLEDKGQDLLWMVIDDTGEVVDAGPYQMKIWKGAFVPEIDIEVGYPLPIHHPPHIMYGYLKYDVEKAEQI